MKHYFRRWAALLLAAAMSFTLLCMPAAAVEEDTAVTPDTSASESESLTLNAPSLAAYSNGTCLTLMWEQVEGAESYQLQRKSGSTWKTIATVSAGDEWLDYADTAAKKNGTIYKYRIRAVSGDVKSEWSSFSSCFLSTIKIKTLKNVSGKKIQVTWKANSKADRYIIMYLVKGKGETMKSVTVSKSKTSKTISGLKKGKTYQVFVNAQKKVNGNYVNSNGEVKTVKLTK